MFSSFFKPKSYQIRAVCTAVATSIPTSTALVFYDHCKRHNDSMSFSNYLAFSVSLIAITMGSNERLFNKHRETNTQKLVPKEPFEGSSINITQATSQEEKQVPTLNYRPLSAEQRALLQEVLEADEKNIATGYQW